MKTWKEGGVGGREGGRERREGRRSGNEGDPTFIIIDTNIS